MFARKSPLYTLFILQGVSFGVWLGLAVDRFNRKKLIILADSSQAAGTLVLLFAIADGHPLWQLYAIVTLQGGLRPHKDRRSPPLRMSR